jgi:hypothetical protein
MTIGRKRPESFVSVSKKDERETSIQIAKMGQIRGREFIFGLKMLFSGLARALLKREHRKVVF